MRQGVAHDVKEVLYKALKNRRHFHSIFDDTTLSWANEALRHIIHQRGLSATLIQTSPSVYNFPKAWLELTASKDLCQDPPQLKAENNSHRGLDCEVKQAPSPFWSTVRWAALDTSRSMRSLTLTLRDEHLHKMASPLHIKKFGRVDVAAQPVSSNVEKKRRRNADAQLMVEANEILGKRSASEAGIQARTCSMKCRSNLMTDLKFLL